MGKLNIAHHKSYHPYRRDNIERVRRDEEEARLAEEGREGRMRVAVRARLLVRRVEAECGDGCRTRRRALTCSASARAGPDEP